MKHIIAIVLWSALPGAVSAAERGPECELSVRPVLDGAPASEARIRPEHVSRIVGTIDEPTGMSRWEVELTADGAAINRDFSRESVGEEIAIFCGDKEVSRPTVVAPSSDSFAFTLADEP